MTTLQGTLVVADDLGSWPHKTEGIFRALESGLVGAASLTPLFPDTARACADVLARGLDAVVGAHLVLTEGEPLTEPIRSSRFCDDEGRFNELLRTGHLVRLSASEEFLLATELRAQVAYLRAQGLSLAHLDSHHHVHNHLPIATIVIALAREFGVARIRLGRNFGPGRSVRYRTYIGLLNRRLRRAGFAGTRYFGGARDYRALTVRERSRASYELNAHPLIDSEGNLVDEMQPAVSLAAYLEGAV